ncbi:MAG: metallophosphoesterase family protein [Crocinitomicaceae bacterium]
MDKKITILPDLSGKLLVFGGVYSNLQALEALYELAMAEGFTPENTICTGDVVAYCAQPQECVDLIRNWGVHCIAGNVEIQLATGADDCGCNFEGDSRCDIFSRQWYPFAKEKCNEETLRWMEKLPDFLKFNFGGYSFGTVHGTFDETAGYLFKSSDWHLKEAQLDKMGVEIMLAGHCGLPFSDLEKCKAWLNSGVVGMPANDGTDRVWFMTLEEYETEIIICHRTLEYDTHEPSARMRESKLPQEYARTLLTGIWDSNEILPETETSLQGIAFQLDEKPIHLLKQKVVQ